MCHTVVVGSRGHVEQPAHLFCCVACVYFRLVFVVGVFMVLVIHYGDQVLAGLLHGRLIVEAFA